MKKDEINARLRAYVREHLSPTATDRTFVSAVYESVQNVLGASNCIQIGSYPRFTAIRPLHDLDVLYILGRYTGSADPGAALNDLKRWLEAQYKNPTPYSFAISRQTHSVTITYTSGGVEKFSVDIVPAYIDGRNEFGDDMYVVPEIVNRSRVERRQIIAEISKGTRTMGWIRSDPRGYITVAARTNAANEDFRRATKFVKGWRAACKKIDDDFPLKSFHLEQAVTRSFQSNHNQDIFDAVFRFFCDMPQLIRFPQLPDRADAAKYIDQYIKDLTQGQRDRIIEARDYVLIQLEELTKDSDVATLLTGNRYARVCASEAYLFDQGIPMLTESDFNITATALERDGGFRQRILDAIGLIEVNRKISFSLGRNAPPADLYKWKVKNDNKSPQPRGEITDHHTRYQPEKTEYNGSHHVECFAIKGGICIGRSRQNVVLNSPYTR